MESVERALVLNILYTIFSLWTIVAGSIVALCVDCACSQCTMYTFCRHIHSSDSGFSVFIGRFWFFVGRNDLSIAHPNNTRPNNERATNNNNIMMETRNKDINSVNIVEENKNETNKKNSYELSFSFSLSLVAEERFVCRMYACVVLPPCKWFLMDIFFLYSFPPFSSVGWCKMRIFCIWWQWTANFATEWRSEGQTATESITLPKERDTLSMKDIRREFQSTISDFERVSHAHSDHCFSFVALKWLVTLSLSLSHFLWSVFTDDGRDIRLNSFVHFRNWDIDIWNIANTCITTNGNIIS